MAGDNSTGVFLTEDIMTSILLRLPTASCIARFRCVCRSWRILLSDPQFILRILCFSENSDEDHDDLQILISAREYAAAYNELRPFHYSLLSYDTLHPISAGDLPSTRQPVYHLLVAGSCDGIFCIVDMNRTGGAPDIILWNPATSETKLLPFSTGPQVHRRFLGSDQMVTGFGFDPRTNDYKVVRILYFAGHWDEIDDRELEDVTYAEVFSLRNGSWKRLIIRDDLIPELLGYVYNLNSQQQRCNHSFQNQSRLLCHCCYWFYAYWGDCFTLTFDMIDEVFQSTFITLPPGLRDDQDMVTSGCFMLKDSLVAIFSNCSDDNYSMWCLMKHGITDSWTKLHTFMLPECRINFLQVWNEDKYICSRNTEREVEGTDGRYHRKKEETDGVYIFSPSTGAYGDRIEVQGRTSPFHAHIFTPTHISLSDLV